MVDEEGEDEEAEEQDDDDDDDEVGILMHGNEDVTDIFLSLHRHDTLYRFSLWFWIMDWLLFGLRIWQLLCCGLSELEVALK